MIKYEKRNALIYKFVPCADLNSAKKRRKTESLKLMFTNVLLRRKFIFVRNMIFQYLTALSALFRLFSDPNYNSEHIYSLVQMISMRLVTIPYRKGENDRRLAPYTFICLSFCIILLIHTTKENMLDL
jgi:CDP-diglyceride synthetase